PPVSRAPLGDPARRILAAALRARTRPPAAIGDGAARRRGPLLPLPRPHLDGPAAALGGVVLPGRGHGVAGVGDRRPGCPVGDGTLAGWLLRPQPGPALLARRGRRRAGLQRALLQPDHHG